jgi:hypothetical protein
VSVVTEQHVWDPATDDVLAEFRAPGMVVHRPMRLNSLNPYCRQDVELHRFGAWVVGMEVGHPCRKCFPKGLPR